MLSRLRYFLSDVAFWVRAHPLRAALALLVAAGLAGAAVIGVLSLAESDADRAIAPAPEVVVRAEEPLEDPADLGFPAFATSNTTRVAGADSIATAAGVALASFPAAGAVKGPDAVTLVPAGDWAAGVAAASLVSPPVAAPMLLTDGDELPELTAQTLVALEPSGSSSTGGRQIFAIGGAAAPDEVKTTEIGGSNGAETAAQVARLRERLTGDEPEHLLVASGDDPEFAMPAAAWAARSGDPVLFAQADAIPAATLETVERYPRAPIYILGSSDLISNDVEKQLRQSTKASVRRAASEDDPVVNAIEFARYVDGTFGWNINDPGHGFVVANLGRPDDAGAAAALSATGTWGPLLLTDAAEGAPAALESYMLDLKPGYDDDPTRAVFNHLWLIGDTDAISVDQQVALDEIVELAPIRSGQGDSILDDGAPGREREGRNRRNDSDDER